MGNDVRTTSKFCSRRTFRKLNPSVIDEGFRCNLIDGLNHRDKLTTSRNQILRNLLLFLWLISLLKCSVTNTIFWPETLPGREYFEANYEEDKDNQLVQSKIDYLGWVVSFYEGTLIEIGRASCRERV